VGELPDDSELGDLLQRESFFPLDVDAAVRPGLEVKASHTADVVPVARPQGAGVQPMSCSVSSMSRPTPGA